LFANAGLFLLVSREFSSDNFPQEGDKATLLQALLCAGGGYPQLQQASHINSAEQLAKQPLKIKTTNQTSISPSSHVTHGPRGCYSHSIYTQEPRGTLTTMGHQGPALPHAGQRGCGWAVSHALHRCSSAEELRGQCGELLVCLSPYKISVLKEMQRSSEKD